MPLKIDGEDVPWDLLTTRTVQSEGGVEHLLNCWKTNCEKHPELLDGMPELSAEPEGLVTYPCTVDWFRLGVLLRMKGQYYLWHPEESSRHENPDILYRIEKPDTLPEILETTKCGGKTILCHVWGPQKGEYVEAEWEVI